MVFFANKPEQYTETGFSIDDDDATMMIIIMTVELEQVSFTFFLCDYEFLLLKYLFVLFDTLNTYFLPGLRIL